MSRSRRTTSELLHHNRAHRAKARPGTSSTVSPSSDFAPRLASRRSPPPPPRRRPRAPPPHPAAPPPGPASGQHPASSPQRGSPLGVRRVASSSSWRGPGGLPPAPRGGRAGQSRQLCERDRRALPRTRCREQALRVRHIAAPGAACCQAPSRSWAELEDDQAWHAAWRPWQIRPRFHPVLCSSATECRGVPRRTVLSDHSACPIAMPF
mmetsp:Transcript_65534/g.175269  ORF Transcript_65534/g.175269 Transcript_65534/m.175269 type:complete len:209 (-) Transcript_65534:35-661(-)